MSKGLEELNKLVSHIETEYHSDDYYECINAKSTIETELKALEIIIKKSVDIRLLKGCKYAYVYNDNIGYDEEVLTDEEFDLLKEVVL